MARIEIVTFDIQDDIDGTPLPADHQSTRFGFNGATFDIDLTEDNQSKLAATLADIDAKTKQLEEQIAALRAEHNARCAELVLPYMTAGRRVEIFQPKTKNAKGRKATSAPTRRTGNAAAEKEHRSQIRYWAEKHVAGMADRGRISGAVTEAFENGRDLAALKAWADSTDGVIWKGGAATAPVSAPPVMVAEPVAAAPAATEAPAEKPASKARKAAAAKS